MIPILSRTVRELRVREVVTVIASLAVLAAPAARAQPRPLILESIDVVGNTRTSADVVRGRLPLSVGDAIDPAELLVAIDALRSTDLFDSVDYLATAGSERGRVRLELRVEEKPFEFRFGTGYRDLDGWYLIPAQLRADNRLGHGEQLRLQARIGYHVSGIELLMRQPPRPHSSFDWGVSLAAESLARPYFLDGIEYRHEVARGSLGGQVGRSFAGAWRFEGGASLQGVEPERVPVAREDDPVRGIDRGDALPYEDLPVEIAGDVGRAERTILHGVLEYDTRGVREIARTPASGFWGRVRSELFVSRAADFGGVTADVRGYRACVGGVVAVRARGGVVSPVAAFYDRFHLGGLYTVRGVPSQSLSPSEGDTRFWCGSIEFRAPLVGRPSDPRVAGSLFVDAGDAWTGDGAPPGDATVTAGWGVRVRVPWIESVGIDVGMPITDSPVGESFHANAVLGWNF